MILTNGNVFLENSYFKIQNVEIIGDRIASLFQGNVPLVDSSLDISNCFVIPGLIDTHFHGCLGSDFSDGTKEALTTICNYELSCGITTLLPATMTLPIPLLEQIMKNYASFVTMCGSNLRADLVGIYLEGPFLSAEKAGAQATEYLLDPDYQLFSHLQRLSGNQIRIVALAPERSGSTSFLKQMTNTNITTSLGHTSANQEILTNAFILGAQRVTHLYNAMSFPETMLSLAAKTEHCMVELICDGVHNTKERVLQAFSCMGDDRIILISDSMRATGLGDGLSSLGGQKVMVNGKTATLTNGKKAGSVSTLYDCFLTAITMGVPLISAIKSVTGNPAKSLHLQQTHGFLQIGAHADILVLNPDYSIRFIIKNGIIIESPPPLKGVARDAGYKPLVPGSVSRRPRLSLRSSHYRT